MLLNTPLIISWIVNFFTRIKWDVRSVFARVQLWELCYTTAPPFGTIVQTKKKKEPQAEVVVVRSLNYAQTELGVFGFFSVRE